MLHTATYIVLILKVTTRDKKENYTNGPGDPLGQVLWDVSAPIGWGSAGLSRHHNGWTRDYVQV